MIEEPLLVPFVVLHPCWAERLGNRQVESVQTVKLTLPELDRLRDAEVGAKAECGDAVGPGEACDRGR